jgi:hypothetical protein
MPETPQSETPANPEVVTDGKSTSVWSKLFASKRLTPLLFVAVFVVIGTATLILTHAASTAGPIKGIAGKCLDDKNGKLKNGNPIQLHDCNGTSAQQWSVMNDGTIRLSKNFCLDVRNAGTAPKTQVWLYGCNGTVAQQWKVTTTGTIVNPHSKLCLDDKYASTANGNPIWMYPCNGTAAQQWAVPKGGTTPAPKPAPTPTPTPTPTPKPTPTPTPKPTPTPTPTPPTTGVSLCTKIPNTPGVKPVASNTGVPAGTSLSTTVPAGVQVSGDSWKVVTDGTIIDGKDVVNKWVDIEANNVTIRNSRIKAPDGVYWAVYNQAENKSGLTVLNSEIYTAKGAHNGIITETNTTVCGVNAHGFENIVSIQNNNVIMQANYFHANVAAPGTNDPHDDVMEVRVGTNIKILGNNLTQTNADESWQHNTGALYAAATYGKLDQLTIDGNWLGGGTYSLYMTTVKGQSSSAVLGTTVDVTNNKWYRNSYAYGTHDYQSPWHPSTWSNNTFEDNGQAIKL